MKEIRELGFDIMSQRKNKGYTQKAIAKNCGVSVTTFQHWEEGTTKMIKDEHFSRLKEMLE